MRTRGAASIVVSLAFVIGCGGDAPRCPADGAADSVTTSALCMSAHELARRETANLNPTQAEIDAAAALVEAAARPLEAFLSRVPAAGPWQGQLVFIGGEVTDSQMMDAWRAGRVQTGVAQVDGVLAAAHIATVQWAEDRFVTLGSDHAIAAGNVVAALAGVGGLQLGFDDRSATKNPYDIVDEGVDPLTGEHRLRFSIGWYECDIECLQQYFWRTGVAADGSSRLIEEWGDPIPENVRADWYR